MEHEFRRQLVLHEVHCGAHDVHDGLPGEQKCVSDTATTRRHNENNTHKSGETNSRRAHRQKCTRTLGSITTVTPLSVTLSSSLPIWSV
jgi:hypothetical protein